MPNRPTALAATLTCLIASVTLAADAPKPNTLTEAERKAGFELLFNGKDLGGWKPTHEGQFRVADGELIADGTKGRGMLYYVGPVGGAKFTQFELRLQVKTAKGANSGVYFLTEPQGRRYPDATGYEAQIANTHKNRNKTGSLYKIANVADQLVKDEQWFDYTIRVAGSKITLRINDRVVVDHDTAKGPKKPHGPTLGLQCHDPAAVKFRTIRIRRLKED